MSWFTKTVLKTLLLLSVCVTAACSTSTTPQCPPPSNDLNTPSAELRTTGGDPDIAADVMRDNGKVLMYDRDRVSRWQQWWKGCNYYQVVNTWARIENNTVVEITDIDQQVDFTLHWFG